MKITRCIDATAWNAGTYAGAYLDTVLNADQYGSPAISPATLINTWVHETGAQLVGGTQPAGAGMPTVSLSNTYGNTGGFTAIDHYARTVTAGDAQTFTTLSGMRQVNITFAGHVVEGAGARYGRGLTLNAFRNGTVVNVLVDGTLYAAVDTWAAITQVQPIYLVDGNPHTIQIVNTGSHNPNFSPIGPVANVVGSSVGTMLILNEQYHPSFVPATWRLTATSATAYSVDKMAQGASTWTSVATNLQTGVTYTAYIPGVALLLRNTTPLAVGDQSTFTTDQTMMVIDSIDFGTGSGVGAGTWTSPVYDMGVGDAQVFCAEWQEAQALGSFTLWMGNSPNINDGSWVSYSVTPLDVQLKSGQRYGGAGLMAGNQWPEQRHRYFYLVIGFNAVATLIQYIRRLYVYTWVPERDTYMNTKMAIGDGALMGPKLMAYTGAKVCGLAAMHQWIDDYHGSYSITGAIDAGLFNQGADYGLLPYSGEQPVTYKQRLLAQSQSRPYGGSLWNIAQQVAALVTGIVSAPVITFNGNLVVATCNGVVAQQLSSGLQWSLDVPPPPYAGLPGVGVTEAQTIIKSLVFNVLNPVTSVINPNNSGGNGNLTFH